MAASAQMRRSNPSRRPARHPRGARIFIAADLRTVGEALGVALRRERLSVVGVSDRDDGIVEQVRQKRPDVAVLDVGADAPAVTRQIARNCPETAVLVLTGEEDDHTAARVLNAGAAGFISKRQPLRDVLRAVQAVHRGQPLLSPAETRRILSRLRRRREQDAAARVRVERLTPRETEILQLMADGRSTEEVLQELGITRHTLRTHIQNILFKLRVHSKVEALAHAIRYGKVRAREPV